MIGNWIIAPTLCATTALFYDLLGRAQDLDLYRLPAERALELSDLRVGLAQLAGGGDVFTRLDGHGRTYLGEPLPIANHAGRGIELAAELGQCLLAPQDPLDRRPFEIRAEDASAVCLPPVFAHRAS